MTPKNRANIQDIGSHRSLKKNGRVYGRAGGREAKGNTGEVTQEQIVAERSALLDDKQGEMEAVLDKHDNLVSGKGEMVVFYTLTLCAASRGVSIRAVPVHTVIRPCCKL